MPLMPGLLRRKGLASDAELRRHSFYSADSNSNPRVPHIDSRASEQIPRRPSAAEFLSPESATDGPAPARRSAETIGDEGLQRSVSPPVQEESQKHRRFSMLKFRHASDSQLSTRGMKTCLVVIEIFRMLTYDIARLQAQSEPPPPLPNRKAGRF